MYILGYIPTMSTCLYRQPDRLSCGKRNGNATHFVSDIEFIARDIIMLKKHRVINIACDENDPQTVRSRVLSDVRATEVAINVPSTPEDYYLYVFNDISLS